MLIPKQSTSNKVKIASRLRYLSIPIESLFKTPDKCKMKSGSIMRNVHCQGEFQCIKVNQAKLMKAKIIKNR